MKMKTSDRTIFSLCEEIDELKETVNYYKDLYEKEKEINVKTLNDNLLSSKKDLAKTLLLAFSFSDDKDGNLVIPKKNRKLLQNNLKKIDENIH